MKLSEQTSLYIAEYLKSALKHSKKYYNESQSKSESDAENVIEKDIKEEERSSPVDEKPDVRLSAESTIRNGSFRKPVKCAEMNGHHDQTKSARRKPVVSGSGGVANTEDDFKSSLPVKHHRSAKRVNDAVNYVSISSYSFILCRHWECWDCILLPSFLSLCGRKVNASPGLGEL